MTTETELAELRLYRAMADERIGALETEATALREALLGVMMTEQLRDLAHQKWQSAQEDGRYITPIDFRRARENNSSACAAHHAALNEARALVAMHPVRAPAVATD